MGQSSSTPPTEPDVKTPVTEEKKKPGPCCACPETRKVRDECVAERGAENCTKFIEAHRECMKKMGYNI